MIEQLCIYKTKLCSVTYKSLLVVINLNEHRTDIYPLRRLPPDETLEGLNVGRWPAVSADDNTHLVYD